MSLPEVTGFEIIEKLGEGGMASVWKARQVSLDRIVAIKVLSSQFASDTKDIERFQQEAQAAAKLKHPGIIQVYDANAENGIYFFIMEYVAGYTVGDWVRRRSVLSVADALTVAECVVDALDYAWNSAGIIHCDIKPDNVMIDSDGTVKVADLGLARTIGVMAETVLDEVLGTPAYMSPEHVAGMADLDCRADIYALGAMLYHLITGKMLFQGSPEESVMDMQLQDCVPDAIDVNEEVDAPVCWLLERMLAKDRGMRHPDWESVRRDVQRVKNGHSPAAHLPDSVVSTMLRSQKRTLADFRRRLPTGEVHKSNTGAVVAAVSAALLLAIGGGAYWFVSRNGDNGQPVRPPPTTTTTTTTTTRPDVRPPDTGQKPDNSEHRRLFEELRDWAVNHPLEIDKAIKSFEELAAKTQDSMYGELCAREAERLRSRRDKALATIMRVLRTQVRPLVEAGKLEEAAQVYENYAGLGFKQTREQRMATAAQLRERAEELENKRKEDLLTAEQRREEMIARLVNELADSKVDKAAGSAREAASDSALAAYRDEFAGVAQLLGDARRTQQGIIQGFKKYAGRSLTIDLERGRVTAVISRVRDDKVLAVEKTGAGERNFAFTLDDLSPRERLMRLGQSNEAHVALLKGIMALRSNAYTHAAKYFNMTDCVLTQPLLARVEQTRLAIVDREAEKALQRVLRSVSISVGGYDETAWLAAVDGASITEDDHQMVRDALDTFERAYGATGFAKKAAPVVARLREKVR